MSIRRYWKLSAVAVSCAAIGAGASAIANAGASTSPARGPAQLHNRGFMGVKRLYRRAIHADVVVATKNGFATVTLDRGTVQSVAAQQLTLKEGSKTATYKTVTLTIPATARVRDNGAKATLTDLKPGQRATVIQAPKRTLVSAHNARTP